MKRFLLPALLALIADPAAAHVTANPNNGVAGTYFQTSFRISHGCDGSATTDVTVKIPDGIMSVHPQAKPGWKITATKTDIRWHGKLASDHYDEFGLLMKLPEDGGKTLWFPVVQKCEKGENRWVDIPNEGQEWHDVPKPAPFVTLTKPVS